MVYGTDRQREELRIEYSPFVETHAAAFPGFLRRNTALKALTVPRLGVLRPTIDGIADRCCRQLERLTLSYVYGDHGRNPLASAATLAAALKAGALPALRHLSLGTQWEKCSLESIFSALATGASPRLRGLEVCISSDFNMDVVDSIVLTLAAAIEARRALCSYNELVDLRGWDWVDSYNGSHFALQRLWAAILPSIESLHLSTESITSENLVEFVKASADIGAPKLRKIDFGRNHYPEGDPKRPPLMKVLRSLYSLESLVARTASFPAALTRALGDAFVRCIEEGDQPLLPSLRSIYLYDDPFVTPPPSRYELGDDGELGVPELIRAVERAAAAGAKLSPTVERLESHPGCAA